MVLHTRTDDIRVFKKTRVGVGVHLPIDKTISVPDVEPFDCTQDFCCCKEKAVKMYNQANIRLSCVTSVLVLYQDVILEI